MHRFIPATCKSVLCPHCAWRESQRRLAVIRNLLEAVREPVGFLTLTLPSFGNPIEAVGRAFEIKRKFYNFRLFGKRKWPQVKRRALDLLEVYLRRIEDDRERERKRRFHLWTIERFERVWAEHLQCYQTKFYLGRILRSVWKFEVTYSPQAGWHPHFHVLVVGYFPLFLLQAVWTMCGGGEVIDLRLARSVDAVSEYVADYEAKPVVDLEGEELPYELQVALEASLYGRRVFEVWGMSELRQEEEREYEFLGLARGVRCELDIDNLHDLPRLVRLLRGQSRDGPAMLFLCWATVSVRVWFGAGEVVELRARAGAYLDADGRIWLVGDERFEDLVRLWGCPTQGGGYAS